MTALFTIKRDERGILVALVLADEESTTPKTFYGGSVTTEDGLRHCVLDEYNGSAIQLTESAFQSHVIWLLSSPLQVGSRVRVTEDAETITFRGKPGTVYAYAGSRPCPWHVKIDEEHDPEGIGGCAFLESELIPLEQKAEEQAC